MAQINVNFEDIAGVFKRYCDSKNYQLEDKKDANNDWRLNISNIKEKTLVIVYHTGSVVVQGKKNDLRREFETLKDQFMAKPQDFVSCEVKEIKACATRYEIVTREIRRKIRKDMRMLEGIVEIVDKPNPATEYRAKVTRNSSSVTITQFSNGTLLVQGKTDKLFDDGCTLLERIADPSDKEVIARFISADEKSLQEFSARYTAQLLEMAENNVKDNIGDLYGYLEPYDRKWFVASECLCLSKVPLPEFSPLVMPVSKAFEGFVKKLITDLKLVDKDFFKKKEANFGILSDRTNPKRKQFCSDQRHNESFLNRLKTAIDMNRHFMMHSDDSKVTKVNSAKEAEEKVATIFKDAREIFEYFNDLYRLLVT